MTTVVPTESFIFQTSPTLDVWGVLGVSGVVVIYKILVFGSRYWVSQKPIMEALGPFPKGTILVEGNAPGADNIAGFVGSCLGFIVRKYPALAHGRQWPSAGYLRNQEMLDLEHPDKEGVFIDRAFCFHEDPDLGKGSKDMNKRLIKAGIPITYKIGKFR